MAINLETYKETLLAAWKDVIDDKSNTDWALFSYEGQTNDLKVVGKGDGGIDEMREELNSGKIMYAFCKVYDPKTSLQKFVLVNWQGEGAPHHRKATSANHIRDVSNLLKGFHMTVNARNEEEIDQDIVTEKLAKASASAYSFKDRHGGETVRESGPVGTTYKRLIPQQEIDSTARDKFWQKEEEEEKHRQDDERKRREEEKNKLESEIKHREIEEAARREAKIKERSKSISVLREAERSLLMKANSGRVGGGDEVEDREKEERERRERSEILKRQRSQEAQALISTRTIDARAVFEQNSSAGQMRQRRASHQSFTTTVKENMSPVAERVKWPPTELSESISPLESILVDELRNTAPSNSVSEKEHHIVEENTVVDQMKTGSTESTSVNGNEAIKDSEIQRAQPYSEEPLNLKNGVEDIPEGYGELGLKAQALYDYQAADDTEISLDPGDIITHIDQIDAGWWQGLAPDGSYGLFPANYVQILD